MDAGSVGPRRSPHPMLQKPHVHLQDPHHNSPGPSSQQPSSLPLGGHSPLVQAAPETRAGKGHDGMYPQRLSLGQAWGPHVSPWALPQPSRQEGHATHEWDAVQRAMVGYESCRELMCSGVFATACMPCPLHARGADNGRRQPHGRD